ncbi:hypothetical protein CAI16_07685 [Virgibacillus dokdonensis]|uniref:Uncharacterized protein n=1 Tax=Virgibacillus dokdonensis TaxID=302167 RepID=A0A3E0WU79_9BACI|nr:hypothetical protein [Virgibacillus dokdonensis]RFA35517.1 hypothetical protein CAI16_07685 [Virgibacillus dokdonensis]
MIPYFSVVHKIGSLPEIQVLQEFTRIENLDRSELAKTKDLIPVMKYKNNKRLPGIRNDGEVIFFFRFDEHKLKEWELNTNHSEVTSDIILRYNRNRNQLGYSASGDSEGSLGGLIEQTKPNKNYTLFLYERLDV